MGLVYNIYIYIFIYIKTHRNQPNLGQYTINPMDPSWVCEYFIMPSFGGCWDFCTWWVGLSPFPVRVTTRIITFLVGNPYKPSFPLLLGGGTTQMMGETTLAIKDELEIFDKWDSQIQDKFWCKKKHSGSPLSPKTKHLNQNNKNNKQTKQISMSTIHFIAPCREYFIYIFLWMWSFSTFYVNNPYRSTSSNPKKNNSQPSVRSGPPSTNQVPASKKLGMVTLRSLWARISGGLSLASIPLYWLVFRDPYIEAYPPWN